jgi:hypothetical protein
MELQFFDAGRFGTWAQRAFNLRVAPRRRIHHRNAGVLAGDRACEIRFGPGFEGAVDYLVATIRRFPGGPVNRKNPCVAIDWTEPFTWA